jgi:hypothetical protein
MRGTVSAGCAQPAGSCVAHVSVAGSLAGRARRRRGPLEGRPAGIPKGAPVREARADPTRLQAGAHLLRRGRADHVFADQRVERVAERLVLTRLADEGNRPAEGRLTRLLELPEGHAPRPLLSVEPPQLRAQGVLLLCETFVVICSPQLPSQTRP